MKITADSKGLNDICRIIKAKVIKPIGINIDFDVHHICEKEGVQMRIPHARSFFRELGKWLTKKHIIEHVLLEPNHLPKSEKINLSLSFQKVDGDGNGKYVRVILNSKGMTLHILSIPVIKKHIQQRYKFITNDKNGHLLINLKKICKEQDLNLTPLIEHIVYRHNKIEFNFSLSHH